MRQETLTLPYQRHSKTSKDAARSMQEASGDLEKLVFGYIKSHGPCTDQEIQEGLTMRGDTERPRRVKLLSKGLIEACGQRDTRSGRKATLWLAIG